MSYHGRAFAPATIRMPEVLYLLWKNIALLETRYFRLDVIIARGAEINTVADLMKSYRIIIERKTESTILKSEGKREAISTKKKPP